MRALSILCLVSLTGCVRSVDPCADVSGTCLAVHVDANGEFDTADELLVRVQGDGLDGLKGTGSSGGTPVALPAAFALLFPAAPAGVSTSCKVEVAAKLNGRVLGAGSAAATLQGGAHASARVSLSSRSSPDGGDLSVAITAPADPGYTNGTVTVELAAGPTEVDLVELLIDGVSRESWTGTSPFRYVWDTAAETEGSHLLTARATSGSATVESPARTVIVDRAAPSVITRVPAPGSGDADTLVPLTVTFSEAMAPPPAGAVTVTAGSLTLPTTQALSADGRSLSITLVELPPLPTQLTVTLSSLTDLAGNALAPASDWSFTAPAWLQVGGDIGPVIGNFLVAAGPQGQLFASYGAFDTQSVTHLHVQRWDGATWHELGPGLSPVATADGDVEILALAVDASGQPLVLHRYRPDSTTPYTHQVTRWNDATAAWESLGAPISAGADESALAADALGNIVATFTRTDGTAVSLYAVRWDGAVWQGLGSALRESSADVDAPSVLLDSQGDAVVSFRELAFGSESAWVNAYRQGAYHPFGTSTWTGLNAFPGSSNGVGMPSLALDHADHPLLAVSQQGDMGHNLYVWRWDTADWVALSADAPTDIGTACAIAVDGLNRPLALYHDNYVKPSAYVVRWEPSESRWVPLGGAVANGLRHTLVVDSNGRAVVGSFGKVLRANQ